MAATLVWNDSVHDFGTMDAADHVQGHLAKRQSDGMLFVCTDLPDGNEWVSLHGQHYPVLTDARRVLPGEATRVQEN